MRHLIDNLESRLYRAGDVLIIRGAERSGGFLEATNDTQRTEQLADINNTSTANGNHGWGQLAQLLRDNGYTVTQSIEPLEPGAPATGQTTGAPLPLETMDLTQYDAIVFASNNAVYSTNAINAVEEYIRNGGGALFISDANFGSSWRDAPDSDTQFLERFGMRANQDNGTYVLRQSQGDFVDSDHPVLFGIDEIDGEGVSPIVIDNPAAFDTTVTRVVAPRGTTWNNDGTNPANNFQGTSRPVNQNDAALVLANAGVGRLAGWFDRNTFFNTNGAGTDITRFDNTQFALNLFNWVSDSTPPWVSSSSFEQANPYVLKFRLEDNLNGTFGRDIIRLRDRSTGTNISGSQWTLDLDEGNGFTDVTITIKSDTPLGRYQLRVERRQFADDSGNVRTGAIRYNFTLLPVSQGATPASVEDSIVSTARIASEVLS